MSKTTKTLIALMTVIALVFAVALVFAFTGSTNPVQESGAVTVLSAHQVAPAPVSVAVPVPETGSQFVLTSTWKVSLLTVSSILTITGIGLVAFTHRRHKLRPTSDRWFAYGPPIPFAYRLSTPGALAGGIHSGGRPETA